MSDGQDDVPEFKKKDSVNIIGATIFLKRHKKGYVIESIEYKDPIEEYPKKLRDPQLQTDIWQWCKKCQWSLKPDDLICIDCLKKTVFENGVVNKPHSFEEQQ